MSVMPELPEIETVRRIVGPQVEGRRIVSSRANDAKIAANFDPGELPGLVDGKTIESADRRAKAIVLRGAGGGRLVIRFGMTGQLYVCPAGTAPDRYARMVLTLDDGNELRYADPRRFGRIWHFSAGEEDDASGLSGLGIEPDDPALDGRFLREMMGGKRTPVKSALLDQSIVAGLGNIWSDEALFRARICPLDRCDTLSKAKWERLAHAIPETIEYGIEQDAVTPEEYLEGLNRNYYDDSYLSVYAHEGKPCRNCGTPIRRDRVGGRSTYWCPKCQRPYRKRKEGAGSPAPRRV